MKLLMCELCGDIIAPHRKAREPRLCTCQAHAVWWEDPIRGDLRVCALGSVNGWPHVAQAWVLGITNSFLGYPKRLDKDAIAQIVASHDDYYLFKKWESCIIRIRPGETSDTRWAAMPVSEVGATEGTIQ